MKKMIGVFIFIAIFIGGSFIAYNYFYGGETYYTKITTNGEKQNESSDTGHEFTYYVYEQPAYNKKGQEKKVTLREAREKPLKINAYLKLKVNPRKGVLSWVEVPSTDVPKAALENLDK